MRILRPQEIPTYVAEGLFDLGITGRDWIEETSSQVESLGELKYSKATAKPVRIVMAVPEDSPWQTIADLPAGVKVSTEYPEITKRHLEAAGVDADVRLSYGATEAKVPDIVDVVVDITETGRALKAAGLRIIENPRHQLHRVGRQPCVVRRPGEGSRHASDPHAPPRRARRSRQGAREDERVGRGAR